MFHKILVMLFIVTSPIDLCHLSRGAQDQPLAIATDGLASYWPLEAIKAFKGRRNNKTSHLIGPDYQIQTEVPSKPLDCQSNGSNWDNYFTPTP